MQYLGEYLAPVNSIALDSDTLTKYFYFRPDMYDNPDADLENIFIIKNMQQFPKRYDLLSENNLYAVDTIEVNKKVTEEEGDANKKVSYVVVASYDLLENIRSRENQNSGGDSADADAEINVDKNGQQVTKETLPWELQPEWSFDHKSTTVPFLFGYDDSTGYRTIPVVNSAGSKLLAETEKYQLQITYRENYQQLNRTLTAIMQPVVNSDIVVSKKLGATFPSRNFVNVPTNFF